MGQETDSAEPNSRDSREEVWTENFLIRKKLVNMSGMKRHLFENRILQTFLKNMVANVQLKKRLCFFKLGESCAENSASDVNSANEPRFDSESEFVDEDQFQFDEEFEEFEEGSQSEEEEEEEEDFAEEAHEEHLGMPKIEETFEESVEDSRMDSPIRKIGHNQQMVDSQIFGLKLSKIQKIGEEHRFIDADNFNFTSNETGTNNQKRGTSTRTSPNSTSASKTR